MTDVKKSRIELLKQFDSYVRNIIGDDEITVNLWLAEGLADGYDDSDLEEIAESDEYWLDCVKCFEKCCKLAGVL